MQGGRFKGSNAAFAVPFYLLVLTLTTGIFASAASAQDAAPESGGAAASFGYKYEGPRFYISLIEIDLTADGRGELRFKRGESDEIIKLNFKLMPETIARIRQLYSETQFLESSEDYQSKKDFSHLGWKTLSARQGEQERKARFNYTHNESINEIANIFRAIATQEIHLFDLETAAQYQPLDLPSQLQSLENDLRNQNIAEPERMLGPLRDMAGNDSVPLIARNHAERIVKSIEKKKYKSLINK
ncbi:MAG TPA: hypothetical protein VNO14_19175 [Blastocatellia bacterium]|nr:hypothetical protein [Blastocatellia bacterium]